MEFPFQEHLSLEAFAKEYWQECPLFLPNSLEPSDFSIHRNEIFELASSPLFTSRIIRERQQNHDWEIPRSTDGVHFPDGPWNESQSWQLSTGPFERKGLENSLCYSHWMLLVQSTEWFIDSMHDLMEQFRFLPNWRLDDLQLSFSTPHGSAGPHVDRYDVFLVQLTGRKTWKIESSPRVREQKMDEEDVDVEMDLDLLEAFHPDKEFTAEPGDVLYLPANIPHYGIADQECITASVGFKAPNHHTLESSFFDLSERLVWNPKKYGHLRVEDLEDPGRIGDDPVNWLQDELRRIADDRDLLAHVFCSGITFPLRHDSSSAIFRQFNTDQIFDELKKGCILMRLTPGCMAYRESEDAIYVYSHGIETKLKKNLKPFAQLLTGRETISYASLHPYLDDEDVIDLLDCLIEDGLLIATETD